MNKVVLKGIKFYTITNTLFVALLAILFSSLPAHAKTYLSHHLDGKVLTVTHDEGQLQLTALHNLAFEIKPINHPLTRDDFPSFAKDPSQTFNPAIKVVNSKQSLTFSTTSLSVQINKQTMQLAFVKNGEVMTKEEGGFFATHTLQGFRFELDDDEVLMGTGERVLGMNRRGHKLPLYNRAHYGYGTKSEQMNYSIPAVMSSKKYVILYDNPAKGAIDLGKTESDVLQFEAVGGRQAYIFIAGDSFPDLIHQYVKVTGKQPLPPRWALGNHASRFGYRTQQEVLDTISLYRELDIPVDSIILDLYWFGKDIKGHLGNLDWDKAAFPNPEKMISSLNDMKVKTTLITEPFILDSSSRWEETKAKNVLAKNAAENDVREFDFYFGHTGLIDVFNEPAKDWFKSIYQGLSEQGITGVWGDLGEPEVHPADMVHVLSDYISDETGKALKASGDEIHNAYGHQWASMVNESLKEFAPNTRPFILMRAGYAGSQRLGMIPWTGDVSRAWDGLKPQPELTMQMSLLGLAYTHSDLGGFAGGETFDKEMYIRWLQYGVFQPIYRPHAQDNIAPEPVFHDKETQDIIRDYIKLRYRLMPYNYSLAFENTMTGMPLMRPMFFANEQNRDWYDIADQYFWGDAFLVKPVTDPGLSAIKITLPEGKWTDFWTGERYLSAPNLNAQGTQISYPLTLNKLPVLVKGGAIIPTVEDFNSATDYSSQTLNLAIYFDDTQLSNKVVMYEDDGVSADAIATGKFEKLIFNGAAVSEQGLPRYSLSMQRLLGNALSSKSVTGTNNGGVGYKNMPTTRAMNITVYHWPTKPIRITYSGSEVALFNNAKEFELAKRGAIYDAKTKRISIKFDWQHKPQELTIR